VRLWATTTRASCEFSCGRSPSDRRHCSPECRRVVRGRQPRPTHGSRALHVSMFCQDMRMLDESRRRANAVRHRFHHNRYIGAQPRTVIEAGRQPNQFPATGARSFSASRRKPGDASQPAIRAASLVVS
jgi:hypothetical protein